MTQTQELSAIFQSFVGEINKCLEGIRQINNQLRHILHEFEEKGGYVAIGYKTFKEFSDAHLSPYMFRRVKEENSARMIEMILGVPINTYSYKSFSPILNRDRVILFATKEAHDNASETGLACNLGRVTEIRSLWQKITTETGTNTPTPAQIKKIANCAKKKSDEAKPDSVNFDPVKPDSVTGSVKSDPVKPNFQKNEYRELQEKYTILQKKHRELQEKYSALEAENRTLKRQIEKGRSTTLTDNIIAGQEQEIEKLKDEKARLKRKNQELIQKLPFDQQLAASGY
jgi:hypothetical protein